MEYNETQTSLRELKNLRTKRDTPVKNQVEGKKGRTQFNIMSIS